MKMYICVPAVPRPFNVVHVANVRTFDDACDLIRSMNVIEHPINDIERFAYIVTSDNPDEPFTFIIAHDNHTRDDISCLFDATPDNVYP